MAAILNLKSEGELCIGAELRIDGASLVMRAFNDAAVRPLSEWTPEQRASLKAELLAVADADADEGVALAAARRASVSAALAE